MEGNQRPDQLFGLGIRHLWKRVLFAINREQIAHLLQTLTLYLGIGLCLYEPGYTLNFLLLRPHSSSPWETWPIPPDIGDHLAKNEGPQNTRIIVISLLGTEI
ncbi:hypothetical protein AVEN_137138-1 [Araneus ventricosus]|uniref:Uncharacterized protein n=1 Tax=Araneus ventricosus TaxID=182803 RepID=A0A4Y2PZX5_ARAVE|nr:hypothetical protein AVEN_137138-1 [Araneus ventricosus]